MNTRETFASTCGALTVITRSDIYPIIKERALIVIMHLMPFDLLVYVREMSIVQT